MLRERVAHRYHSRTLFGMYPRNRRGESSRWGDALGSSVDRAGGNLASRRSVGGKLIEAKGAPLSYVMYSRLQFLDGVLPLVSRRILETLTYLARNHPNVAKLLLQLELPRSPARELHGSDQGRGKAVMVMEEDDKQHQEGDASIVLLLSLLNLPLYLRSIAHLEQLLNLLEVVIDNAESSSNTSNMTEVSPTEQPFGPEIAASDAGLNSDVGASSSDAVPTKSETSKPSTPSHANKECDVHSVLLGLPQAELRLLCSLLAREGLSDNAYALVGEVLKKLVSIVPTYCHLFIRELATSVQVFGEAEKALLSSSSNDGTAILRVLQALSSLVACLQEKEKDPEGKDQTDTQTQVRGINSVLDTLWLELSTCISKIESYSDTAPDLLPASRSLSPTTASAVSPLPAEATTSSGQQRTTWVSNAKGDEKNAAFVKFSEKHRKLLNAFIRQNPGLLEKLFTLMLKVPRFFDFDNKRSHFRSKIKHQHDHHHSPLRISVRRAYILEDSYN
ncbi:hypothetical protein MKX03_030966 [Papaver bracteatum]|nr:hypothetical protein MKX03_030966 [Papaver bracteatum]